MALLGNYSILHKSPAIFMSGQTGSGDRANRSKPGSLRNRGIGGTADSSKVAIPTGYYAGGAWLLPQTAGDLTSRGEVVGDGDTGTGNLAGGLYGVAGLVGIGDFTNANLGLIVSGVAAMAGSGAFTNAAIAGKLDAVADLVGSGAITAALGALASALATLGGNGTLTATPAALGALAADLTPFTELSPQTLAAAVWSALDAVETGLTPAEALRIIAAATAGKSSGFGTGTVTFRNAEADSKDRIVATVDGSGNRTGITIDKS